MHKTKWAPTWLGTTNQPGIDLILAHRNNEIYVQVKTATFRKTGQNWTFTPYRAEKGLDEALYNRKDVFFGMVCFHCKRDEFFKAKSPFHIKQEVLVVPGERVVRYFETKGPKSHNITVALKKYRNGGYDYIKGKEIVPWGEHRLYYWLEGAHDLASILGKSRKKTASVRPKNWYEIARARKDMEGWEQFIDAWETLKAQ